MARWRTLGRTRCRSGIVWPRKRMPAFASSSEVSHTMQGTSRAPPIACPSRQRHVVTTRHDTHRHATQTHTSNTPCRSSRHPAARSCGSSGDPARAFAAAAQAPRSACAAAAQRCHKTQQQQRKPAGPPQQHGARRAAPQITRVDWNAPQPKHRCTVTRRHARPAGRINTRHKLGGSGGEHSPRPPQQLTAVARTSPVPQPSTVTQVAETQPAHGAQTATPRREAHHQPT